MTVLTESLHSAECIISEANGVRSRETITLASGQNLGACAVLGKITATGLYTELAPGATDGSETAAAVLISATDASAADTLAAGLVRDAEINGAELAWPDGITSGQKDTAIAELADAGLIVR